MNYCLRLVLFSIITSIIVSCTTFRANVFMLQRPNEVKAFYLFEEGEINYIKYFVESKDLEKLPKVREMFSDAFKLDPNITKANDYIDTIDTYFIKLFNTSISKAQELVLVQDRSDTENYELVFYAQQASQLNLKHDDLKEITNYAKELKPDIINTIMDNIKNLESEIINEENHKILIKKLYEVKRNKDRLLKITNGSDKYMENIFEIQNYILRMNMDDIIQTRLKTNDKKYIEAELIIRQTEQRETALNQGTSPEIEQAKYELFYSWGDYLINDKKYKTANNILKLALNINPTEEIKELLKVTEDKLTIRYKPRTTNILANTKQKKIVIEEHNDDDDIEDMISSINFYISNYDFFNAKFEIDSALLKIKLKNNKVRLKELLIKIEILINELYTSGIALYNEEDYQGAFNNFDIVKRYNDNFDQIEAYFDKTVKKLKALSGE